MRARLGPRTAECRAVEVTIWFEVLLGSICFRFEGSSFNIPGWTLLCFTCSGAYLGGLGPRVAWPLLAAGNQAKELAASRTSATPQVPGHRLGYAGAPFVSPHRA